MTTAELTPQQRKHRQELADRHQNDPEDYTLVDASVFRRGRFIYPVITGTNEDDTFVLEPVETLGWF